MNLRLIRTLITPVTCGRSKPGKTVAHCGIVLVHIAAVGLATAIQPTISGVIGIAGMAIYMIGARHTMKAAESTSKIFRA